MRLYYDVLDMIRIGSGVVGAGAMLFVAYTVYQTQSQANQILGQTVDTKLTSTLQDAPLTQKLPLAKRVIGVTNSTTKRGSEVNSHIAVFGNWLSHCTYTRTSSNAYANCTVAPYNGGVSYQSYINLTYLARLRVRYRDEREPMVEMLSPSRLKGSEIGLKCSDFVSKGPENKSRSRIFTEDAERLVSRMKLANCTMFYYDAKSEEVVENTFLSHGFSQADSYAKQFARSPKVVS